MTRKLRNLLILSVGIIFTGLYGAIANAQAVSQVTVVTVSDAAAYNEQLKVGKALMAELGSRGDFSAWRAQIAGTGTGAVAVMVQWPSMMAFAEDGEKVLNSPRWAAWIAGLGEIRTIYSVGLYNEIDLD